MENKQRVRITLVIETNTDESEAGFASCSTEANIENARQWAHDMLTVNCEPDNDQMLVVVNTVDRINPLPQK